MNANSDARVMANYIETQLQPLRDRIAQLEAQLAKLQPEPKRMPWTSRIVKKATQ